MRQAYATHSHSSRALEQGGVIELSILLFFDILHTSTTFPKNTEAMQAFTEPREDLPCTPQSRCRNPCQSETGDAHLPLTSSFDEILSQRRSTCSTIGSTISGFIATTTHTTSHA